MVIATENFQSENKGSCDSLLLMATSQMMMRYIYKKKIIFVIKGLI